MRTIKRNGRKKRNNRERPKEGERERERPPVWITKKFNFVSHKSISVPFISSFSYSHCYSLLCFLTTSAATSPSHCCHPHHIVAIPIRWNLKKKKKQIWKERTPTPKLCSPHTKSALILWHNKRHTLRSRSFAIFHKRTVTHTHTPRIVVLHNFNHLKP